MKSERSTGRQLAFLLGHAAATGRADFLVGEANQTALALIDGWPAWPEAGVLLVGPSGSGKSHLTEIWRAASGGDVVRAADLDGAQAERAVAAGAIGVEDLEGGRFDEAALFHLINLAREHGAKLLLTSAVPAQALAIRLPDLASRLRLLQPVALAAPEDELLRRVLGKLFADRQLAVDRGVIDYIVVRMERSFAAANLIVARLDEEGLAEGRAITRQFAGEVLDRIYQAQSEFWPEAED